MIYGLANSAQFRPLLWAVLLGAASGVVWDVLRFFRFLIPPGRVRVFAEDVFFFLWWAVFTFLLCYATNYGIIRSYILLAQPFGFFTWYLLPGRLVKKVALCLRRVLSRCFFKMYLGVCRYMCTFSEQKKHRRQAEKQKTKKNLIN